MIGKGWRLAAVAVVLGAAATVLALSAGGQHREAQAGGIERAAPTGEAGERARERAASTTATSATFGPNVGSGRFIGVSTAVSALPIVVPPVVTQVNARDNEN